MKRGMITISETGAVVVPEVPVWMTLPEIADQSNGISFDVYSLEMVVAVSFRIQSRRSRMCRQFLMKQMYSRKYDNTTTRPPVYLMIYKNGSNRQGRDKGNKYN